MTPWHASSQVDLKKLCRGAIVASDAPFPGAVDLSADLARLRANLTPEEGLRFQELGGICARAMDAAIKAVRPGQTEFEIAARLSAEAEGQGVQATVNLIATDERISYYRHPLPTAKKLEKYAMLILCGRKYGLVCSLTRLVHFGQLPDELRRKMEACARVDATFIRSTRPGTTLGDIFSQATATYAATGFPDEWQKHHQGGTSGYEPREYLAVPRSTDRVILGQAYAWNPSITGIKSEDTMIVHPSGAEFITVTGEWPFLSVNLDDRTWERPAILTLP